MSKAHNCKGEHLTLFIGLL